MPIIFFFFFAHVNSIPLWSKVKNIFFGFRASKIKKDELILFLLIITVYKCIFTVIFTRSKARESTFDV